MGGSEGGLAKDQTFSVFFLRHPSLSPFQQYLSSIGLNQGIRCATRKSAPNVKQDLAKLVSSLERSCSAEPSPLEGNNSSCRCDRSSDPCKPRCNHQFWPNGTEVCSWNRYHQISPKLPSILVAVQLHSVTVHLTFHLLAVPPCARDRDQSQRRKVLCCHTRNMKGR